VKKYGGSTRQRRERLAKMQDGICLACQLPFPDDLAKTEVDHIIPLSRGGPDLAWNRRLLHFACNRDKWNRLTGEAVALAVKHGVVLHEPPPPRSKYWWQNLPEGVSLRQYLNELQREAPSDGS